MATTRAQRFLVREGGETKRKAAVQISAGVSDAGKVVALTEEGKLDISVLPAGVGVQVTVRPASEALAAGSFVNLWNDGGTAKYRLADATNNRPADGFVKETFASGTDATVYPLDSVNTGLSGLTVGAYYFLGSAGGVTTPAYDEDEPTNDGRVSQKLGKAISATELVTDDYGYVIL